MQQETRLGSDTAAQVAKSGPMELWGSETNAQDRPAFFE